MLALAVLSLLQLGVVSLIYRRARDLGVSNLPQLCPLAIVAVGVIANGVWWWEKGYFDIEGALSGLSPVVLAVVCHGICERFARKLVGGPAPHLSGGPWT